MTQNTSKPRQIKKTSNTLNSALERGPGEGVDVFKPQNSSSVSNISSSLAPFLKVERLAVGKISNE